MSRGPSLAHEPGPPIEPLKVEVVSASAKNTPPPELSLIALEEATPTPTHQSFESAAFKAEWPGP